MSAWRFGHDFHNIVFQLKLCIVSGYFTTKETFWVFSALSCMHNVTLLFHTFRCDLISVRFKSVCYVCLDLLKYLCSYFYELILLVTPESYSNSKCSVKGYVLQKILALCRLSPMYI